MSRIEIQIAGVAAELVLGNYMPQDNTIFHSWEDFYHYNDILHVSQLLPEHISSINIKIDGELVFEGKIPMDRFFAQKSISPAFEHRALYLRTECVEQAVFECSFEAESFDKNKLTFETQDYDLLFKVGKSFLSKVTYDGQSLPLEWVSAQPIGNLCLLCRFENGYLVPLYDAVKKVESK